MTVLLRLPSSSYIKLPFQRDGMFFSISGSNGLAKDFSKVSKVPRAVRPTSTKVPSTQEEQHILFQKTESSQ